MRSVFREDLMFVSDQLVGLSRLSAEALAHATDALMRADLELAQQVITEDDRIDAIRRELDARAIDTLARQQPVATDLRQLVSALRMSSDFERCGDLANHVAKLARMRYPEVCVPEHLAPAIVEMSAHAQEMVRCAGRVVADQDVDGAVLLEQRDDAMDRFHRDIFRALLDPDVALTRQQTIDMTLLSRYLERFADHAVSVGVRVVYLVTGVWHDQDPPISPIVREV